MPISLTNESMLLGKVNPRHRAWIEINPSAIEANTKILINCISKKCLLMAVVKADGYGHGAITVAKAAIKAGAYCLGVATLQEALDLRKAGLNCPILLLGNLFDSKDLDNDTIYLTQNGDLLYKSSSDIDSFQIVVDNGGHIKASDGISQKNKFPIN